MVKQEIPDRFKRYESIFHSAPVGILIVDLEGNILDLNQQIVTIMGSPSVEATRAINVLTFPPLVQMGFSAAVKQVIETSENNSFEGPYRSKWGREIFLKLTIAPIFGENGVIESVEVITIDDTRRRIAELKEEEYRRGLGMLGQSARELITISEEEEIFKYVGGKMIQFFPDERVLMFSLINGGSQVALQHISGLSEEESRTLKLTGTIPLKQVFPLKDQWRLFLGAPHLTSVDELFAHCFQGVFPDLVVKTLSVFFRDLQISMIPVIHEDQPLGLIFFLSKSSQRLFERKGIVAALMLQMAGALNRYQVLKHLREAKEEVEASLALRSNFLAKMSHEIRTPMNGILGFAELLKDELLTPEEREEFLDIIMKNGRELLSVIDNILEVSSLTNRRREAHWKQCYINLILNKLHSRYLGKIISLQLPVEIVLLSGCTDQKFVLITDGKIVIDILTHLLENSLKFTREGRITFGYTLREQELLFFVKDTGIGIPHEKQTKIFEYFQQVDNSISRAYDGLGVGLSISQELVTLLGGRIWLESIPDQGTSIYFTIPRINHI